MIPAVMTSGSVIIATAPATHPLDGGEVGGALGREATAGGAAGRASSDRYTRPVRASSTTSRATSNAGLARLVLRCGSLGLCDGSVPDELDEGVIVFGG